MFVVLSQYIWESYVVKIFIMQWTANVEYEDNEFILEILVWGT